MTAGRESSTALEKAFCAALLLTGSPEAAEYAVLGGIAALDCGHIADDVLLVETAKAAIQCRADFPTQSELALLLQLAPIARDCFILRVLLGINVRTCSKILRLGIEEFREALYAALQELPRLAAHGAGL